MMQPSTRQCPGATPAPIFVNFAVAALFTNERDVLPRKIGLYYAGKKEEEKIRFGRHCRERMRKRKRVKQQRKHHESEPNGIDMIHAFLGPNKRNFQNTVDVRTYHILRGLSHVPPLRARRVW